MNLDPKQSNNQMMSKYYTDTAEKISWLLSTTYLLNKQGFPCNKQEIKQYIMSQLDFYIDGLLNITLMDEVEYGKQTAGNLFINLFGQSNK